MNARNYKVSGKKLLPIEFGDTHHRNLIKQGVVPGAKTERKFAGRLFKLNERQIKKAYLKLENGGKFGVNESAFISDYIGTACPIYG